MAKTKTTRVKGDGRGQLGGGMPKGHVTAPRRARAEAIQRHVELDAAAVIEQIARGALYDIGDLFYTEFGRELHAADGPQIGTTSDPSRSLTGIPVYAWRKGDVKRDWNVGDLKPFDELTEAQRSCIAGFEVVMKNAAAGDGKVDRVLKVKLSDRAKFVDMAGRYHALFRDKLDVTVTEVGAKLDAARLAAAARNKGKAK